MPGNTCLFLEGEDRDQEHEFADLIVERCRGDVGCGAQGRAKGVLGRKKGMDNTRESAISVSGMRFKWLNKNVLFKVGPTSGQLPSSRLFTTPC